MDPCQAGIHYTQLDFISFDRRALHVPEVSNSGCICAPGFCFTYRQEPACLVLGVKPRTPCTRDKPYHPSHTLSCSPLSHGNLLFTPHGEERSPTVVLYCLTTLVTPHSCLLCSQRLSAKLSASRSNRASGFLLLHALANFPGLW